MPVDVAERPSPFPEFNDPELAKAVVNLQASPPLDLTQLDFNIHHPQRLVDRFGNAIPFFHGVESRTKPEYGPKVTSLHPGHIVLMHATPFWVGHEEMHGQMWQRYMQDNNMPPLKGKEVSTRIKHADAVEFMMALLVDFQNIVEWDTAAIAEINEFMTEHAYLRFAAQNKSTEPELYANTHLVIGHEALHFPFYKCFRHWVERKMIDPKKPNKVPWELYTARKMYKVGMRAVGDEDFGPTVVGLMLEEVIREAPEEFGKRIQQRASIILDDQKDTSFVDYFGKVIKKAAKSKQ